MNVKIEPADIFLTRGSSLLSGAIRFFTRTIGEKRTKVNHVGLVISEGSLQDCVVIEALSTEMEKIENCKVVFVTKNGNATDPILGMLTNTDIVKYSKA